jgi:hypothetical protein
VVDLPTGDDALTLVGALAVVGVFVADVDLAELVLATLDALAMMGVTVEVVLICMIACL